LTGLAERLDLRVGSVVRVVLQDDPTVVAGSVGVEAIVDAESDRPLALRVESASAGTATYVVRDTLSIGRAPDNDIVVADSSVSRYHAKVRAITGGVEIEDCGSSNGLVVDGARVARAALVPQESVQLGDARVTVERPA
jgi:pSer/pThr/pTyr-binding forkhead associated (FHA) protein